jgi:nicotinate (nicotinamide) nucleotide adenylyltransferase
MKKILFYPATFNPPHIGHSSLVLTALQKMNFDEVWILPSGKRVDKEISDNTKDREEMSRLFVEHLKSETNVPIRLVTDAINNTEGKYTHEVIMDLKSKSNDEIYQLAGTDGYTAIKERVIGPNEKFIISKREGFGFPDELYSRPNLTVIDEAIYGISSTIIREMVKNGDIEYKKFVPNKIADYIENKGLYL